MTSRLGRLRLTLAPQLGATAWILVAANAVSSLGTGLTLPFLVIYLHLVRSMSLAFAGSAIAIESIVGLATAAPSGTLIDKIGPRRALAVGVIVSGLSTGAFAFTRSPAQAALAAVFLGAAGPLMWSGFTALFSEITSPQTRPAAFAANYQFMNVGIGFGGVLAGALVSVHSLGSFQAVFLLDGLSYLILAAVLALLGRRMRTVVPNEGMVSDEGAVQAPEPERPSYRLVLKDRLLLGATLVNTLIVLAALGQVTTAFPAWTTAQLHLPASLVGYAFAADTLAVVCCQPISAQIVSRSSKTTMTACAAALFAVAWLVVYAARFLLYRPVAAGALLIAGLAIFGFAETFLAPSLPVLVNDIAPASLRGRYNSIYHLSQQAGAAVGPIAAGMAMSGSFSPAYLLLLGLICLIASAYALSLKHLIPAPREQPAVAAYTSADGHHPIEQKGQ